MKTKHRVIFKQDPAKLILDISALKNGSYLVDGHFTAQSWQTICDSLCLPALGGGSLRLEVIKEPGILCLTGTITTELMRECVRSGQQFFQISHLEINEQMPMDYDEDQHTLDIEAPDVLDVGDFVTEQLMLGLDSYPIHPSSLNTPRGEFNFKDKHKQPKKSELKPTGTDGPFSVLAQLK